MILQPVSNIKITQNPTVEFPLRSKVFNIDFITEIEINSSWKNITDTAKVVFPYNIQVKNEVGNVVSLFGAIMGKYVDESGAVIVRAPLLSRGDAIEITLGYFSQQEDGTFKTISNVVFRGFITKVNPNKPIEIECEDAMYLLKQVKCPNKLFQASKYTIQTMMEEILKSNPLTKDIIVVEGEGASANIKTSVGNFRTQDGVTAAQVLDTIRKDFKLECYMRYNANTQKDELRCSGIVYYPSDRKQYNFDFNKNIIDSGLEYTRVDDVKLGVKAYSIDKKELQTRNSRGQFKTKQKRLEVFVGDTSGEKRTLYFYGVTTVAELEKLAIQRMNRFRYEGWKGQFETFGLPMVKHGDSVILTDKILPERNGTYFVKSVKTTSGQNGFRQSIELDLRIDVLSKEDVEGGL